eukprot:14070935-Alexandrium_andersonii.AAC.1
MAGSPRGADPPPHRLIGAPSEPPPNGCRTRGEDAFIRRVGAPRSGALRRSVRAPSPFVRRPCRGGSEGAP